MSLPTSKCSCQSCGIHLEFPVEMNGATVKCPQCNSDTVLAIESNEAEQELDVPTILANFTGQVPKTRVSIVYQISLLLVTAAMVLLPVLYIALIGVAASAVWFWWEHFRFLLSPTHSGRLYLLQIVLFITPLVAGFVVVLFMIKPLFAKRRKHAQPLALNPGAEPLLYTFIDCISKTVGAPAPTRIDLNCELNAAAGFRRGFSSFFKNDLVLTIGLPLVASLNTRQLAGIVAHEFGHFTQGFGMRLTYIIRSVNGWFARVVYERDAWDEALEEWADECEDLRAAFLVGCVRFAVWCSRLILKVLMYIGHGIGCAALKQMEYNADSYEIKLIGSACFEETSRRLHVASKLLERTYKDLRPGWNLARSLPDNFSAFLMRHDKELPEGVRTRLEDTMGLEKSSIFDTHPSPGDRIRKARQAGEDGIFHLEMPATALFANFEVPAKQVTFLHYTDDLGIPDALIQLAPVNDKPQKNEPEPIPDERPVNAGPWRLRR
jgi:Zn-dependent protease with chaperone function